MNKTLIILRSVSSAGKTSFANLIERLYNSKNNNVPFWNKINYSADELFEDEQGNYNFEAELLSKAHKTCIKNIEQQMNIERELLIVSNTSCSEKELHPYLDLAIKYNYQVFSLIVEKRHNGQNLHNVPLATLEKQEQRLRNSIKLR